MFGAVFACDFYMLLLTMLYCFVAECTFACDQVLFFIPYREYCSSCAHVSVVSEIHESDRTDGNSTTTTTKTNKQHTNNHTTQKEQQRTHDEFLVAVTIRKECAIGLLFWLAVGIT